MDRSRALLFSLLFVLSGTALAQVDEPERLRIHGSNLLGASVVPAMVESWLKDIDYVGIKRRELGPARTQISASRDGQALLVEIDKRGSTSGISGIIEGNADISMSARRPTAKEIDDAWQLGDLTSSTQEWVVAIDGLVLVVAPGNPVSKLSLSQLRDVLSGKTRDWRDVGGRTGPIQLHAPGSGTGTQELLTRLALAGGKTSPRTTRHASYAGVVAAVRADSNGIGVISLRAPLAGLKALSIRDGARAIAPSLLSAASEDYPLSQRLYLHTGQLVSALGRGFAQYAISPAGQAVVARSQFVPLGVRPMQARAEDAPWDYQQIVGSAERLPMTLHFAKGLDLFDSRGRQDVERLAVFLARPENARRKLVLVAFANPDEKSPYQSLSFSQERVDFVASELLSLNMKVVTVRGLGGRMNLVDARQPSASYRNDRVEVWLR